MRNFYNGESEYDDYDGYGGYDEYDDPMDMDVDTDGFGPDDRIDLETPDEAEIAVKKEYMSKNLTSLLRAEIKRPYWDRGTLNFRFNGEDYEGVPMLEINPGKFVFEVGDKKQMKTFVLSDIIVL